jgi:hypothetical protein
VSDNKTIERECPFRVKAEMIEPKPGHAAATSAKWPSCDIGHRSEMKNVDN